MDKVCRFAAVFGPGKRYVFIQEKWTGAERVCHIPGSTADIGYVVGDLYKIEFDDGGLAVGTKAKFKPIDPIDRARPMP
jgi:hypothetical protein